MRKSARTAHRSAFRRLAYAIQKMRAGYYYFIQFEGDANCPNEVESHVRIMEPVMRYLCVKQEA